MYKSIQLTNQNETTVSHSVSWSGLTASITHNLGADCLVSVVDTSSGDEVHPEVVFSGSTVKLKFGRALADVEVYQVRIVQAGTPAGSDDSTSDTEEHEYYSGTAEDVLRFCKSLHVNESKLGGVSSVNVMRMQQTVDDAIDGYLNEYYFTPLHKFSQMQSDGTVRKVFPGKIRFLALQWTAGLLLQTEFQNVEPNTNEQGRAFIEEAKKEMQAMVDFSVRIPGQRRKHPSPTMPPNLAPSKTNEFQL